MKNESREIVYRGVCITVFSDGSVIVRNSENSNRRSRRTFGQSDKYGYRRVKIMVNGVLKNARVHRLVALAFIPNPDNKPSINHRNGDKSDNRVENLEWCTAQENVDHMIGVLGYYARQRKVRCIETGRTFDSVVDAARSMNIGRMCIEQCIHGRQKTAGGYHFERCD